jgi:hypothetical protein
MKRSKIKRHAWDRVRSTWHNWKVSCALKNDFEAN